MFLFFISVVACATSAYFRIVLQRAPVLVDLDDGHFRHLDVPNAVLGALSIENFICITVEELIDIKRLFLVRSGRSHKLDRILVFVV